LAKWTDLRAAPAKIDFKLALYEQLRQPEVTQLFQQLLQKYQADRHGAKNLVELDSECDSSRNLRVAAGVEMAANAGVTQVLAGIEERVTRSELVATS
jgi:hypothetical protein